MAEQAAKAKKEAAEERLVMGLDTLNTLISAPEERRPERKLRREIAAVRATWESFDKAHFGYMEELQLEQSKAIEREVFKEQYQTTHGILEQVEDLLDAFAPAAAPPQPPRQPAGDDVLYGIARVEQMSFLDNARDQVASVEACLQPAAEGAVARKESRQELEELNKELDQAVEHMQASAMLTKEMNKLKPDQAEENIRHEAETVLEVRRKIDKQRRAIAMKLAMVAVVPEVAAANNRNRMGSDTYMYQRRPMPKFDGQKRNYPAFKREWQTGITGRFDADYEVREMKLNVPVEVEPDIKNLTTMVEVWGVLDSRYGKVMELTKELISDLQCFTFSKQATTSSAKFLELHREWVKVYSDLQQIDRLSVLDHEPTLCTLAKQLPSDDSKMRYTKLRLRRMEENEDILGHLIGDAEPVGVLSNLDIMNEFMRKERELQVSYGQLLSTENSRAKPADSPRPVDRVLSRGGGDRRCYKCDKTGHQAWECPSQFGRRVANKCVRCNEAGHDSDECTSEQGGGVESWNAREANANTSIKPKNCPACKQQHSFMADDGSVRYKCRLSCCEVFRDDLGPSERANLLEKVNGCALCTDWTGSHRREQCVEKTGRGVRFGSCPVQVGADRCGKGHHTLLHGTTSKFTNFVAMSMVRKDGHSRFGTGRLLDGQHPSIKGNVMMENPQAHALRRKDAFRTANSEAIKESSRINMVKSIILPECEEMGAIQPRGCGSCTNCQQCSEAKVQLSRKEQEELTLIESNVVLEEDTKQVRMKYSHIKDPLALVDNRKQVIAMARSLKGRLSKAGQLEAYDAEVEGHVHRGAFKELSEEEMRRWGGVVNYISHQDVPKPGSTTALRIVSNSSLANPVTEVSYSDSLPKGPNALVPLFEALIRWRSYEKTVVWDLRKAYNTVVTYAEEMHARRLVWRWGVQGGAWTTYGINSKGVINRMHFGHRPAMCRLSVGLGMTAEAGDEIDPEAASMIKLGYGDNGVGGGDQVTVDRLVGKESWVDGKPHYDGTVQTTLNKGSFEARWLWASVKGERGRCRDFPRAEKLTYLIDSSNTAEEVKRYNSRLANLSPQSPLWSKGRWVTKGRLGQGMFKVLGVEKLPVLTGRLAELVMLLRAHKSDAITIWTSRNDAWIWQERRLAKRASRNCVECKSKWAKSVEQRIGDLPEERLDVGGKPFKTIKVRFKPRRHCRPGRYKPVPLDDLTVAVQRLVLLVKSETGKQAGGGENEMQQGDE